MVFEAEVPALGLVEHSIRIDYDAAPQQLS
jgi:hypothetical protein